MLNIEVDNLITCTCHLTDEDEQKVRDWVTQKRKDNEYFSYQDEEKQIAEAVYCLWIDGQIDLYKDYTESDSSTEEVRWSEFEERTAEEVLSGK